MKQNSIINFFLMRIFLSCMLLLWSTLNSIAQDDYSKLTKIINITPPSPNAAALGEYGKAPVGLTTGSPQISVPLYTLKTQNLELPLELSYSTNGVKVDQIASRTGVDWVLNAGGVISRTVYGSPDEYSSWLSVPPSLTAENRTVLNYLKTASQVNAGELLTLDTQPDMFTFNFNGHTGVFTLDTLRNIVLIKYENIKIEKQFSATDWNFKITTGDGIVYYFGGFGATETTTNVPSSGACEANYVRPAKTAWYLTKMVHPKGDSITFSYSPLECTYANGISQSYLRSPFHSSGEMCSGGPACPNFYDLSTCISEARINGVVLSGITSSSGDKIKLINSARSDINNEYLIDSIEVYHKKNYLVPYRVIDLQYNYSNSRDRYPNPVYVDTKYRLRPFLTAVVEKNGGDIYKKHAFHYNDYDGLPERLSFAQDHYGYYNGKNNSFLIPGAPLEFQADFPMTLGNREPDPVYAMKGVLSKVIYPTGGYDTLLYEGHTISVNELVPPVPRNVIIGTIGSGVKNRLTVDTLITPTYDQTVHFHFSCNLVPGQSYEPGDNYALMQIFEYGNIIYTKVVNVDTPITYSVPLYDGRSYKIEVNAYGKSVRGEAAFSYGGDPVTYEDKEKFIGGVRIAKIKSYNRESGFTNTRKFYYGSLDNLTKSSGTNVTPVSTYFERFHITVFCEILMGFKWIDCGRVAGYSSSMRSTFGSSGSHIYYKSVVESQGEDFENGGIEHQFMTQINGNVSLIRGYHMQGWGLTNAAWENGIKTKELYFSKVNNNIIKRKLISYAYTSDIRNDNYLVGYIVRRRYADNDVTVPPDQVIAPEFRPFDVMEYAIKGNWIYMKNMETTLYDDNGAATLTTKVDYAYDNALHASPTRTWTTQSDGSEEIVTTSYPLDYAPGTAFIDSMKASYQVAAPIEKVKYTKMGTDVKIVAGSLTKYYANSKGNRESELLLENNTPVNLADFKFSNRAKGVLLPAGTATTFSPDPRYKERLNYNSYDVAGNMKQYTLNGGTGGTYLWGYNAQYPIAEIKNAGLSDVAYTSFESNEWGNWTSGNNTFITSDGLTGKQCYALSNGAVSKSGLATAKQYIVSFWAKSGAVVNVNGVVSSVTGNTYNNWTYNERTVTNVSAVTVSGTGNIDELRLLPVDAQMITTTYEPSVGIIGRCNERGDLSFYEYDLFGRLKVIRDQNGKILKQYDYQYLAPIQQ